jgi:carbon-monoxide dehydrogenase large subunit
MIAGDNVKQQVVALAARSLGVAATEIDVEDGRAVARGGNKPVLTFGELARLAQGMPGFSFAAGQTPGLEHTAYFTPPQASYSTAPTSSRPRSIPDRRRAYSQIRGRPRQRRRHQSDDRRRPVQGGVAHGIGNALFEFMRYDADAQPLTTSFADYLMPMAPDVPACMIEHVETPNPLNPLGVKGAGEGGTIPAPAAIIAAIEDALSPFGVHFAEMPLTPARIVAALREAAGAYADADESKLP